MENSTMCLFVIYLKIYLQLKSTLGTAVVKKGL